MGDIISSVADVFGFGPASKAADASTQSAAIAAAGSKEAAAIAADAAKFRPYNVRTALGGVSFGDQTVAIDYDPALAAYRANLFRLAGSQLPQDIAQAEEAEYQQLRSAADPASRQQFSQLGTNLFRTGRQGLDIYGSNPELRAFQAAQIDKETQLREQAKANVAGRIAQSSGLFQSGVGVEQASLQPLEIGAQLGGRSAQAGAAQASLLFRGGLEASQAQAAGARQAGLIAAQSQQGLFSSLPTYRQFVGQQQAPAPVYGSSAPMSISQVYGLQDYSGGYSPF
jgi:hypothetical protein